MGTMFLVLALLSLLIFSVLERTEVDSSIKGTEETLDTLNQLMPEPKNLEIITFGIR
jgi:hypothetical protein